MINNSDSIDISLSGIYRSWYAFRAGKHLSQSILAFEYSLEDNLAQLANDLQSKNYRHGTYRYMVVNDSKRRSIAIASVRDRVVHRLLYDYFVPLVDHRLDYDVWSCRTGKGLQASIERTKVLLQKYPSAWIWRSDITKFFDSVDHATLKKAIGHFILDTTALELLNRITESYHTKPGRGIAIGNLTSQILSNIYLNEFDRFVRLIIKPLGYVRYGDDFIVLMPNQKQAQQASILGERFLVSQLKLTINSQNNFIVRSCEGLIFLGAVLYSSGTRLQTRTWKRLESHISANNQSSYWGLVQTLGSRKQRKELGWITTHDPQEI